MSAAYPTPWTFEAEDQFEDSPIRAANGNYVLVRDSGVYPPDLETCREIVEAVNERDRLREEILDLKCERDQLWEIVDRYERERMELCHKIGRREKDLSETANERDRVRDLVRRMAPTIQYQYDFMEEFRAIIPATPEQMRSRDKSRAILAALIREAREALGEVAP